MNLRSKRIVVTQEEAEMLNALQQKTEANARALQNLFGTLLKTSEVEADLERLAALTAGPSNPLGEPFPQAMSAVRSFQWMLAEEIVSGITHALRVRETTRKVLADKGILAAKESGEFDDVEVVVAVGNPSFSVPTPDGAPS